MLEFVFQPRQLSAFGVRSSERGAGRLHLARQGAQQLRSPMGLGASKDCYRALPAPRDDLVVDRVISLKQMQEPWVGRGTLQIKDRCAMHL